MLDMFAVVADSVVESLLYINDPKKRIYWLYLLSAGLIALLYILFNKQNLANSLKKAFSPSVWLSTSSLVDMQWLVINQVLRTLLIIPIIGGQLALALWLNKQLYQTFGEGNLIHTSTLTTSIIFTCVYFILEDFSRFYIHYLYHKVPLLWRFHAIHHSAEVLTPLTLYRIHSIEMIINSCRSLLIAGLVSGLFIYLFRSKIGLVDIIGANIFVFLFNVAGANLRHSSLWISFGRLENWFISPAQHQIHHSAQREHFDKNMGATLAIWDKWFATLLLSKNQKVEQYGVGLKVGAQSIKHQFLGIK